MYELVWVTVKTVKKLETFLIKPGIQIVERLYTIFFVVRIKMTNQKPKFEEFTCTGRGCVVPRLVTVLTTGDRMYDIRVFTSYEATFELLTREESAIIDECFVVT